LTRLDPKHKDKSPKLMGLVLWIIPVMNLLLNVIVYLAALDREVNIEVVIPLFFGALFVVIGNYLPKCEPSYTIGIKLPWTLEDEQNWNATHRLAGWLWVAGGLLIMPCTLLPPVAAFAVMMGILLVMLIIPTVYSYQYYKKHKKQ
ncbi:MAG: SdpI family protein, partial [Clostridia bacterium]|nr:SdpI family protein [Clostridia bacterium]